MKKTKKTISFQARVVALMVLCWILPLIMIAGVNVNYMTSDRLQSQISKEIERMQFADHSSAQRLERLVEASRAASHDRVLMDAYEQYKAGATSQYKYMNDSFLYIREKYGRDTGILMATLWYREDPERLYCSTFNTLAGATYTAVNRYWKQDHDAIMKLSETIDTKAVFVRRGSRLYLVRNLLNQDYENVGTLVLLLNPDYCFRSFRAFPDGVAITMEMDDCEIQIQGDRVTRDETGVDRVGGSAGYSWTRDSLRIFHDFRQGDHDITTLIRYSDGSGFALFRGMDNFFAAMLLLLIPLIAVLLHEFYKHVTTPIRKMMEGADKIEEGQLGYQLDYEPKSTEFKYLTEAFNNMSSRLEYQFRHIYEEELALRDAKIKALQSHINPHFMNNTLEIINWEARMAGNDKVSEMIEALSTLMNAGIDRKMRPVIPLSEEMVYVNAYLHIIKERLGSRLTLINEFPEDIMGCMVPRLILQPVIENAIEHGVVENGRGTVLLYGYRDGDYLYLEIMNESAMSAEDEERIARLLAPDYDTSKEPSGSLGIANVNQRLRIIYGDTSGLTVQKVDDDHVCARLTIRVNPPAGTKEEGPVQNQARSQDESTNGRTGYSNSPNKV